MYYQQSDQTCSTPIENLLENIFSFLPQHSSAFCIFVISSFFSEESLILPHLYTFFFFFFLSASSIYYQEFVPCPQVTHHVFESGPHCESILVVNSWCKGPPLVYFNSFRLTVLLSVSHCLMWVIFLLQVDTVVWPF